MFDFAKLKGRIREKCETETAFAAKMGMNRSTMSSRLTQKSDFSAEEIWKACQILSLTPDQIGDYFFRENVAKTQHQHDC